jgi:hypothetical protein
VHLIVEPGEVDSVLCLFEGAPKRTEASFVEQAFQKRPKSRQLSPHHRFVIALHSPEGVVETGLLKCPLEKMAAKLGSCK